MNDLVEFGKPMEWLMRDEPIFVRNGCGCGMQTAVEQFIEFGKAFIQSMLCLFECCHVFALRKLHGLECFICSGDELHFSLQLVLKLVIRPHLVEVGWIIEVFGQFLFRGIPHQCVAATDVEVDVRQRVEAHVVGAEVNLHHRHHLQEQAQLGNLGRLHHDVHAVEIAQDNAFIDEILDVTTVLVCDFLQFRFEPVGILCVELLHPLDAYLIERFKDVHCREKESTRTAGRVKDGDALQCLVEVEDKQTVISIVQQVIDKRADVKVISDEVVDVRDFTFSNFSEYILTALQPFHRFAPYLRGQCESVRCFRVPVLAAFQQVGLGSVKSNSNIFRNSALPVCRIAFLYRVIDIAVATLTQRAPHIAVRLECFRRSFRHLIHEEWQDAVLADVFGDVLLGVVSPPFAHGR